LSKKINILSADEIDHSYLKKFPSSKYFTEIRTGISNEEILEGDYDAILIRSTRRIDNDFVKRYNGKVIATFSKGTDHIDTAECKSKGIKVLNAKTGNSTSAAEHTFAMILAASKNLLMADRLVREGKFTELIYTRNELRGKKLGIIGFGSIGKIVGKFGKSFGMAVFANDRDATVRNKNPRTNFKSIKYLMSKCDVVTIHIPLDEKNRGFIDEKKLSYLKKDCIFINTSRGEVVDENALMKLLQENKIRFACLDVFKNEPNVNTLLFGMDNVILSNHAAGKTPESKRYIAEEVFGKLMKFYNIK
jgi:D-3-phosphoglycerate dehydrogenase / 2-oxoglutarate reductase